MRRSVTAEGAEAYFEEYVFGVPDFDAYLEKIGGLKKLHHLKTGGAIARVTESIP